MSDPDVHLLTGAYALDALGDIERHRFEAHLDQCPECAREVRELRATAAMLAVAAAEQPPARLREQVLARIAVTGQDTPVRAPAHPAGRAGRRVRAARPSPSTAVSVAAAAAIVVVLAAVTIDTARQRDAAQAELAQTQARYAPMLRIAAASDARGASGVGVVGGSAFALVSRQLNQAVLMVSDLPTPPPGRTYQAWVIGAGRPRSVGLLAPARPGSTPSPLTFGDLGLSSKIGLTIEPAGGSPQPTTIPVVLLDLPT